MVLGHSFPEVLPWLKTLPVAPEYRPTLAEFQDPIAYILRIEQEASLYGICKIVPPLPSAPKSTVVDNLNLSFCSRSPSGDPTFTTRQQQIGFCPRRLRPVQKSVWQSGNRYTLQQFEARARSFERSHIRKSRKKNKSSSSPSPLEVESLFWKVATDKPASVEYANDMPGSGFSKPREEEACAAAAENVGETAWNMRRVARSKGSLLRFMREEIPGVTSPMVYVAMMFSWFAWHVEDHDLHSLNYLHMGSPKTWYGVPMDVAKAFEEVVRVHGYGGEVNPLITFATLAEKTTLMSPEVLIESGIPCCRLVQNAGEFVVTFPGSYHSGFSHGFNCGEASNIATPAWLKVAKEAAIRRASTNCPPMVSHYQLLYALALSLCLRSPSNMVSTPKSLRLKNKYRCLGETMIKETFVHNVMQNNDFLNILLHDGSSCVILPQRTSDPLCSTLQFKLQMKVKPRIALGLCHGDDELNGDSVSNLSVGSRSTWARYLNGFIPAEEKSDSIYQRMNLSATRISALGSSESHLFSSKLQHNEGKSRELQTVGVLDQGFLSCVTCGILSYSCVAIIQPREATVEFLMPSNSYSFVNHSAGFEEKCDLNNESIMKNVNSDVDINLGNIEESHSSVQVPFNSDDLLFDAKVEGGASALALLASAYGNLSDSEEDAPYDSSFCANGNKLIHSSLVCNLEEKSTCPIDFENIPHNLLPTKEGEACVTANCQSRTSGIFSSITKLDHSNRAVSNSSYLSKFSRSHGNSNLEHDYEGKIMQLPENQQDIIAKEAPSRLVEYLKTTAHSSSKTAGDVPSSDAWRDLDSSFEVDPTKSSNDMIKKLESNSYGSCPPGSFYDTTMSRNTASTVMGNPDDSQKNSNMTIVQISDVIASTSDKSSSRMHVFCLEHAVEVQKRLRPLGGVDLMLLCHPEYPKIEFEAKHLAEELGLDHEWKDIHYRDATLLDQEKIRTAIDDEAVVPCTGDWAVKLGINLYYSVDLSQSPLFRKQMPYNEVLYQSFSSKSPLEQNKAARTAAGRRKKITFTGKWCGKVWMSNQVHPYLNDQSSEDFDDERDLSSEPDCYKENRNRATVSRKSLTTKNATARRKPDKKCESIRNTSHSKLNTNISGADINLGNTEKGTLTRRSSANRSVTARRKLDKKGKNASAVSPTTMKPGHAGLKNSCGVRYPEEHSQYAKNTDDGCEADADTEDNKQALVSRRIHMDFISPARKKSDQNRKKLAVRSNMSKSTQTRLENSATSGCAFENSVNTRCDDGDGGNQNRDELIEEATLPVRILASTGKSEFDIDSDLKKGAIPPRRTLTSNIAAASKKSDDRKRKRSNGTCTRKAVHTNLESFKKDRCGIISCLRSSLRGINREPSSMILRKRHLDFGETTSVEAPEKRRDRRKVKKALLDSAPDKEDEFPCDLEGCSMSFGTRQDLNLHKRNICPEKGCGKKFFSHKYLLQHRKVHSDDRPLRCPWKGCKMTFKWAWARTEHIRVHTGERPYSCREPGCNLTFRFVSDFSRHRRKTGH